MNGSREKRGFANALPGALTARLAAAFPSWLRDRRGSVSVETVFGALLVVTTAVAGMDLYQVVDAQWVGARGAGTMASYVSLEAAPRQVFLKDLAAFSYRNEIARPADAAFVVSAVSRDEATDIEPDPPVVVRWSWAIAIGEDPDDPPEDLAESCRARGVSENGEAPLLAKLGMEPGEMVVMAQVCVRLLPRALVSGRLLADTVFPTRSYQLQVLPVRGDRLPEEPS